MSAAFDVAIAGLGATGSAAAYHGAARGLSVVGFDRFTPPHATGSSHGGSRIIRRAYFEGAMYVPLLNRAYELWRSLERESGRALFGTTGALTISAAGSAVAGGAAATAARFGIPHEVLNARQVAERFPAFSLPEDHIGVWEPDAGWIHPERAIETHLSLASSHSAELHYDEPVMEWYPDGAGVRLTTSRDTYSAARLILCVGGWTASLARANLPLRIERQVNVWYTADSRHLAAEHCPVYVWEYDAGHILYGFPDLGEGVKAGLHHDGDPAASPEAVDRLVRDADVEALSQPLRKLLPSCGEPLRTATCLYTNSPDGHYLIDRHPEFDQVVLASACSGHGFKASNAVGEAVVDLATGTASHADISPFRLRF